MTIEMLTVDFFPCYTECGDAIAPPCFPVAQGVCATNIHQKNILSVNIGLLVAPILQDFFYQIDIKDNSTLNCHVNANFIREFRQNNSY